MNTNQAAVLEADGHFRIHDFPLGEIDDESCLLEVEAVGLCGTDLKIVAGTQPAPRPVVIGHEILGTLREVGSGFATQSGFQAGDRVIVNAMLPCWSCPSCWSGTYRQCTSRRIYGVTETFETLPAPRGGLTRYMHIDRGSILHPVEPSVPTEAAVMLGILANGIDWVVRRGRMTVGDRILIQGPGPQGIVAAMVALWAGAGEVFLTGLDVDRERLEILSGDSRLVPINLGDGTDSAQKIKEHTGSQPIDLILEVSGATTALEASLSLVKTQGRVIAAGLSGSKSNVSFDLNDFVWRDIELIGSLGKDFSSFDRASSLLPIFQERLASLVTHTYRLEDSQKAMDSLSDSDPKPMKVIVTP